MYFQYGFEKGRGVVRIKRELSEKGVDSHVIEADVYKRQEAYCKYTGRGMEEILKGTPVLGRGDVKFVDFQLEKGVYCSCCTVT